MRHRSLVLLLTLILCALGIACSVSSHSVQYVIVAPAPGTIPKKVIPVYIDKAFSAPRKAALISAVATWNHGLNQQIVLRIVSTEFNMEPTVIKEAQDADGFLFLQVEEGNKLIPDDLPLVECRKVKDCHYTLAWADRAPGHMIHLIRSRLNDDDIGYVALHEIAHLLGMQHTTTGGTLSFPTYSKDAYLCIDYQTMHQIADRNGLNIDYLNYCRR